MSSIGGGGSGGLFWHAIGRGCIFFESLTKSSPTPTSTSTKLPLLKLSASKIWATPSENWQNLGTPL